MAPLPGPSWIGPGRGRWTVIVVAVLAAQALMPLALSRAQALPWRINFTASVVDEADGFNYVRVATVQGPADVACAIDMTWVPPALRQLTAVQDQPPAPPLAPGNGWRLDGWGEGTAAGTRSVYMTTQQLKVASKASRNEVERVVDRSVLTIVWKDRSAQWWRQNFGAGGRATTAPKRIAQPELPTGVPSPACRG